MVMTNQQLTYGDFIFISAHNFSVGSKKHFLYSDGFFKNQVSIASSDQITLPTNIRKFLFQIFPAFSRELNPNESSTSKQHKQPLFSFQREWKASLLESLIKVAGKPVLYEDVIQLCHVESLSFVQSPLQMLDADSLTKPPVLSLVQENNNDTLFRIETLSNYFHPGEKIFYDAQFFIRSLSRNQIISVKEVLPRSTRLIDMAASTQPSQIKRPISKSPTEMLTSVPNKVTILHMNDEPTTTITFVRYASHEVITDSGKGKIIHGGDYVRLYDMRFSKESLEVKKYFLHAEISPSGKSVVDMRHMDRTSRVQEQHQAQNRQQTKLFGGSAKFNANTKQSGFVLDSTTIFQLCELVPLEKMSSTHVELVPKPSKSHDLNLIHKFKPYILMHYLSGQYLDGDTMQLSPCKVELSSKSSVLEIQESYGINFCSLKFQNQCPPISENTTFLLKKHQNFHRHSVRVIHSSTEEGLQGRSQKALLYLQQSNSTSAPSMMQFEDASSPSPKNRKDMPQLKRQETSDYHKDRFQDQPNFLLAWGPEDNSTVCFRCERVSEEEIYDINFISSLRSLLDQLGESLNEMIATSSQINPQTLKNTLSNLLKKLNTAFLTLLAFLTDCSDPPSRNRAEEVVPEFARQNLLRELEIFTCTDELLSILLSQEIQEVYPMLEEDANFKAFVDNYAWILELSTRQNQKNTTEVVKNLRFFLHPAVIQQMTPLIIEVLHYSDYTSLQFILEVLNKYIYDNKNQYFDPDKKISLCVLQIIKATSKFKTFCVALQRYRGFWDKEKISTIFPALVTKESGIEIHLNNVFLMSLEQLSNVNDPTQENRQKYVQAALEVLVALGKNLPNYLRLYSAFESLLPYATCLSLIKIESNLPVNMKKTILRVLIHFHLKYFLTTKLFWSSLLIRAFGRKHVSSPETETRSRNSSSSDIQQNEPVAIPLSNQLSQKRDLMDVFNVYRRQLREIKNFDQAALEKILSHLEFLHIFMSSNLIEFPDKKPYLTLYKEFCDLSAYLENELFQYISSNLNTEKAGNQADNLPARIESKPLISVPNDGITKTVYRIRNLIKEILLEINESIEGFFAMDFLQYIKDKPAARKLTEEEIEKKNPIELSKVMLTRSSTSGGSPNSPRLMGRHSSNALKGRPSKFHFPLQDEETIRESRRVGSAGTGFIEINLDHLKHEENLKEFLDFWDLEMDSYGVSLRKLLSNHMRFTLLHDLSAGEIKNLEKISMRSDNIVLKLKKFIFLENYDEIAKMKALYKTSQASLELVEEMIREQPQGPALSSALKSLLIKIEDILRILGLSSSIVSFENCENILHLKSKDILDLIFTNKDIILTPAMKPSKFQDIIRITNLYTHFMEIFDYLVTLENKDDLVLHSLRFHVIVILIFFVYENPTNADIAHKLIANAYFYEAYTGKTYSEELLVYLQTLISRVHAYSTDAMRNEREQQRIFEILFEPFFNEMYCQSFGGGSSPHPNPDLSPSFMRTPRRVENTSVGGSPSPRDKLQDAFSPVVNAQPINLFPDPQNMEGLKMTKYRNLLMLCSISLINIKHFFKSPYKVLLESCQKELLKLFKRSFKVFQQKLNDLNFLLQEEDKEDEIIPEMTLSLTNPHPKEGTRITLTRASMYNPNTRSERKSVNYLESSTELNWFSLFENLISTLLILASSHFEIRNSIIQSVGTIENINKYLINLPLGAPYSLRSSLFKLGNLLFMANTAESEDLSQEEVAFVFLGFREISFYVRALANKYPDIATENLKAAYLRKAELWKDLQVIYNFNFEDTFNEVEDPNSKLTSVYSKHKNEILDGLLENNAKLLSYLLKHRPSFCMEKLVFDEIESEKFVVELIIDLSCDWMLALRALGLKKKITKIQNQVLSQIKENKQFKKYQLQLSIVDQLTREYKRRASLRVPTLPDHDEESISACFLKMVEAYFKESSQDASRRSCVRLLVELIEENKSHDQILKNILLFISSPRSRVPLPKSTQIFFYVLLQEIISYKIEVAKQVRTEFEYYLPHIRVIQLDFNAHQLTNYIYENLIESDYNDLTILLELCNKYLFGGCKEIQESFYYNFLRDSENRVVLKISSFLKRVSERLVVREKLPKGKKIMNLLESKFKMDGAEENPVDRDARMLTDILYFIQLLCEGHNSNFQAFFHEQAQSRKLNSISVNFPMEIAGFLHSYVQICSFHTIELGKQLFNSLTEIVQGNRREIIAEVCTSSNVIEDILNLLIKYKVGSQLCKERKFEGSDALESLKSEAITLLLSIVESADAETRERISQLINKKKLAEAIETVVDEFLTKKKFNRQLAASKAQQNQFLNMITDSDFSKGLLIDSINLLIVTRIIEESSHNFKDDLKKVLDELPNQTREWVKFLQGDFFKMFVRSIEIIDSEKTLRKIFFPLYPSCRLLSQEQRNIMIENIERSSYHTKISQFLSYEEEITHKIDLDYGIQGNKFSYFATKYYTKMKWTAYAMAYAINVLVLVYFDNEDLVTIIYDHTLSFDSVFYDLLNGVQLCLSILLLIMWTRTNQPRFHLSAQWARYNRAKSKTCKPITYLEEQDWYLNTKNITEDDFLRILELKGPNAQELKFDDERGFKFKKVQYLYYRNKILFLLRSGTLMNHIAFMLICLFSIIYHPMICSLQLLNFLAEAKIMKNIIGSFYKNAKELATTVIFGIVIIFIYSQWGYFFLRETLVLEGQENICTSIWHCFLSLMNYGMRAGGGIGDVVRRESYMGPTYLFTARWLYDVSFFILISIVMMNMIFGIVIDTFSSQREAKQSNFIDQTSKCFICDIEKGLLDRIGGGFEDHVRHQHNMWNYIFYLKYIKLKGVIDLSEIESYIYHCYKNKIYSWVPHNRATCMPVNEDENEMAEFKDKLDAIEAKIDEIALKQAHFYQEKEEQIW